MARRRGIARPGRGYASGPPRCGVRLRALTVRPVEVGVLCGRSLPTPRRLVSYLVVISLLVTHASLLVWGALTHSPVWDEVGHLAAGISHWQFGRFDLYRVNPPLVRMAAAVPVFLADPKMDWRELSGDTTTRDECSVGLQFVEANGRRYFTLLSYARWACIPFSLLGAFVCYWWASRLYGRSAGTLALTLWCFSPNVIAHGQLITPDAGATALGVTAACAFWRWLDGPTWIGALLAGIALGLAELTKTTWIVLFPLWPLLCVAWRWPDRRSLSWLQWRRQAVQLMIVLLVGCYMINLGYGFAGSFQRLGDFRFRNSLLTGPIEGRPHGTGIGNRFADHWAGRIPIPFPKDYMQGLDLQKWDFERKMTSYLAGEWKLGGWWYYYLYALAIKVPLGTWLLVFGAAVPHLLRPPPTSRWSDWLLLA